jgi:MSHA biogenesis protein MshP
VKRTQGSSIRLRRRGAGFTLVSAIFMMVVLVILAASLVTISAVQHTSAAQQLQATRANYAARAAAEWATRKAQVEPNCALWPSPAVLTLGGSLTGFTVTVSCSSSTVHAIGTGTQAYYIVDVDAQGGVYGSVDFVQRKVQIKVLGP